MSRRAIAGVAIAAVLTMAFGMVPVRGSVPARAPDSRGQTMDLSSFSDRKLERPINLLFIHHSVGGQMLADKGADAPLAESIHRSHPNGGGLRALLETGGFRVHEASYKSKVGDKTDLFDWLPKFRTHMDLILRTKFNDTELAPGETNQVVMWKSCFPNSEFVGEGTLPGNPAGPELTTSNAKATFTELRKVFEAKPSVLFVYLTAPPIAAYLSKRPLWKHVVTALRGRPTAGEELVRSAALARRFNDWVVSPDGWLKDYPHKNVVVIDYYDMLTGDRASDLLKYPTDGGSDSHPSSEGNQAAASKIAPLLLRAVRRAGLAPQ